MTAAQGRDPRETEPRLESAIPLPLTMGRFILRTLLLLAASHENHSPRAEDCVVSKLLVIIKKTLRPPLIPPVILLDLLSGGAPGSHSLRVELLVSLKVSRLNPSSSFTSSSFLLGSEVRYVSAWTSAIISRSPASWKIVGNLLPMSKYFPSSFLTPSTYNPPSLMPSFVILLSFGT